MTIRFRCPSCRHIDERPDGDAGRVVGCSGCGQSLVVPPAHFKMALPAEPLPPRHNRSLLDWVWRPAPRTRRENSGETLVRFALNLFTIWLILFAGYWTLIALLLILSGHWRG